VLATGCTTASLWKDNDLDAWNEPAYEPHVHLFSAPSTNDLLVVYNEYHERNEKSLTRAYWLNENQKRIEKRHTPHFVSTNLASSLSPVPVLLSSTNEINLPTPCALLETNGQSFTFYSATGEKTRHDLPIYKDGKGKTEKILLTPLAVTADITIVGGVIAFIVGYAYVENGGCP